jgi:acetolactate synthase-1/2/3 large subunit
MTRNSSASGKVGRRSFLAGVAAAGAATGIPGAKPAAAAERAGAGKLPIQPPSAALVAAETAAPHASQYFVERAGSDFMVDTLKHLGIEYVAGMPGSSFRGLHESVVNYGGNSKPELLTCLHEESSVGMAHGYAKASGKPMAVFAHGTVGLQHASMAVYNAWCDRVPIVIVAGNTIDATMRRPGVEWLHSVQDAAALLRDFTKWDDLPGSLQHFSESMVRAYKIATTPPMGPVVIVADSELQEQAISGTPSIPKYTPTAPPQGDSGAVKEAAKLLVGAQNPLIIADRLARSPEGMKLLVQLAETLGAPVVDKQGRMNFPTDHYLNQADRASQLVRQADVILGLEMVDFWGTVNQYRDVVHREWRSAVKPDTKLISISVNDLYIKANFQDFERFPPVDVSIGADGEATLPALIEAVKGAMNDERRSAVQARTKAMQTAFKGLREKARLEASYAWDASPITVARLCAELWEQVKGEDWSLVSDPFYQSSWPHRLWNINKHHQFIGNSGGYGVGYGIPAAVGAALAQRAQGRLTVNIQGDGDLMCAPGVLWTAAHHKIPLLSIMHNNRSYHQEIMHVQRIANRRTRGIDRTEVGTEIANPDIDYAKLAQSMGVWGSGPISDPKDLGPALKRAIQVVKSGEPALLDVVAQPR